MTSQLDRDEVRRLIQAVADQLPGKWLVVGGAYAALRLRRERVTQDIDMVGIQNTNAERLALMELAEQYGYPIETINSAADYFVRKFDGWEDQLEELVRGSESVVYGPSLTLFIMLKVGRMSEQDLEDCIAAVRVAEETDDPLDWTKIERAVADASQLSEDAKERQQVLLSKRDK